MSVLSPPLLFRTAVSVLALGLSCGVSPVWAAGETIVFDGSNPAMLRTEPVTGVANSLFPAASLAGNNVTVAGGAVNGYVFGAAAVAGNVANNRVSVTGGLISGAMYGGYTQNGDAFNNSIIVSGGVVNDLTGGETRNGHAFNNQVIITGGRINSYVYGGYSWDGDANHNSVVISGGQFNFNTIYGGGSYGSFGGDAIGNSINLFGAPDLSTVTLVGGWTGNANADYFTGNSLNVRGFSGAINGAYNFENYDFYLNKSVAAGGAVLTITNSVDLANTNIHVSGVLGGSSLAVGDKVALIDAPSGVTGVPLTMTASAAQGIVRFYDFQLESDATSVSATVTSITFNPQAKALAEGRAAGLAFANQGADLASGLGLDSAMAATTDAGGFAGFAAIGGGDSRYDTGSHVDVSGVSVVTGFGWRASNLLLGAFVEAGWGSYDSHNSFTNAASVKGGGDTDYYGGGLLGRYDFNSGVYGEASLRAGRTSTDFSSSDLYDGVNYANYDSSAAYYGAHAGLGYVWAVGERTNLDLSTKYLWTHQNSDSANVSGDTISFSAANSHRWRNGARFHYEAATESESVFAPYVGAAYEYEFDGEAKATVAGYILEAPSLKGGTGVGELGVRFKPAKDSGLSVDLGVQGYVGVREGVAGTLQAKYNF